MTLSQDVAGRRPGSEPPPAGNAPGDPMALGLLIGQLPFWGLLFLVLHGRRTDAGLTRDGFRTLTEKTPPVSKQKQPVAPEAPAKLDFPGDGYRPQQIPRQTA